MIQIWNPCLQQIKAYNDDHDMRWWVHENNYDMRWWIHENDYDMSIWIMIWAYGLWYEYMDEKWQSNLQSRLESRCHSDD